MLGTSLWAFMATWFTPTILFCVLNLMIGTIFIVSNFKPPQDHHLDSSGQLAPAPSLLQRVKSVNFSNFYTTHEPQHPYTGYDLPGQLVRNPSLLERVKSIDYSFSSFSASQPDQPHHDSPSQLVRTPSMLERVKSINLSSFYAPAESERVNDSPGQIARAPSLLDRVKSFKISPFKPESEPSGPDPHHDPTHHVNRSKSDKSPAKKSAGKMKMKKSQSEKMSAGGGSEEEDVDRRRPATMREAGTASFSPGEDDGVDSKAEDFINRFKQQLKLQRLDSILRYKEMLNRGT